MLSRLQLLHATHPCPGSTAGGMGRWGHRSLSSSGCCGVAVGGSRHGPGGGDAPKLPPTAQEASGVKLSTGSPLQLVTPRRHWGRDGKLSPAVGGPPPPWAPCVTPGGAGQALQELLCPTAVRVTAPAPCRASCDSPSPGSCPALLTRSLPWGWAAPRAELPAPCVTVRAEGVTVRRKHPLEAYAVTEFFHR